VALGGARVDHRDPRGAGALGNDAFGGVQVGGVQVGDASAQAVSSPKPQTVAFATAHQWVARLGTAKRAGKLDEELERLRRIPLVCVDEVGYIPFDPEAAALFFALTSSRYEQASMIVNSNKTFSAWAEIFGDPVAVAAMVDRLVHHAEVIALKGHSYRLKGRRKEVATSTETS
jgi:DNA replication protein DnaC